MKVKFTARWSARQGQTAEVTDAAGERLIAQGLAEKVTATKAKASDDEPKPTAKKSSRKS